MKITGGAGAAINALNQKKKEMVVAVAMKGGGVLIETFEISGWLSVPLRKLLLTPVINEDVQSSH